MGKSCLGKLLVKVLKDKEGALVIENNSNLQYFFIKSYVQRLLGGFLSMDVQNAEKDDGFKAAGPVKDVGDDPMLKGFKSFGGSDIFFRADKIDLKSLDLQLDMRLNKTLSRGKNSAASPKEKWEIDPSKLELRYEVAHGTFGIVYRGIYDGQDVAGISFCFTLVLL